MKQCTQHRGYAGTECMLERDHKGAHQDRCGYTWSRAEELALDIPARCSELNPSGRQCVLRLGHSSTCMFDHEDNVTPTMPSLPQIFLDAAALISGPRRESYGDYASEAQRIATGWSAITGFTLQTRHVPMMMIWLKLVREAYRPSQDNRDDCAGYLALLDQMLKEMMKEKS